jgi:hypothetical protein
MSILHQFALSNVAPQRDRSPIGRFRRRLVTAVELQIDLANSSISGESVQKTRERWVKNKITGARELKQVPVRVRPWWFKDEAGKVHLKLKYGAKTLELAPGKNAIEVGGPQDLPTKLSLICDAIRAGELDACAETLSFGRPLPKKGGPSGTATKKAVSRK